MPNKKVTAARKSPKQLFNGDIQVGALLAELFGTLVLTSAVLATSGNVIIAALVVIIMTLVLGALSGAHLNPAFTLGLWSIRQIKPWKAVGYVVAQLLGAMLAVIIVSRFMTGSTDAFGSPLEVFKVKELAGTWVPFFAEAFGAVLFGIGIASVVLNKKVGFDAAFAIGGSLLLGLILATLGSASVLNPAVALGLSAYTTNGWTYVVYALGPVAGVAAGMWLYKLMQWDTKTNK